MVGLRREIDRQIMRQMKRVVKSAERQGSEEASLELQFHEERLAALRGVEAQLVVKKAQVPLCRNIF